MFIYKVNFLKIGSHHLSVAGLEIAMYTRLTSSPQSKQPLFPEDWYMCHYNQHCSELSVLSCSDQS